MSATFWSPTEIPALDDKIAIVTGSNSGIGKETALVLAKKGARVILAVRNTNKGEAAKQDILKTVPGADVQVEKMDLSQLQSVREFAKKMKGELAQLDLLINNAGVMACPFGLTEEGFETQIGTNHFGHFALAGLLFPLLKNTPNSRLVVLGSIAHRFARFDFDDINWEKRKFDTNRAYADSKLANLWFFREYQKRFGGDENAPVCVAAHPGWTSTELQRHVGILTVLNKFFAQSPEQGAWPTLLAATSDKAKAGGYYGPSRFFELNGSPKPVSVSKDARNDDAAARLWELSEKLTEVKFG